jgi:activator of HSP90 ATPase
MSDDTIHQEVTFAASPKRVYEALMDEKQHGAFTGAAATISREPGGAYSCHDGQIVGRNLELEEAKRIVQAWRVAAWPEGVYSVVKFELAEDGDGTRLTMDHAGVPAEGRDMVAQGWQMRYWEPMAKYFAG